MCDLISITTWWSFSYSVMSHLYFSLRWVVRSYTRWSNITSNSGVWVLGTNYKHPMIKTLWVICKFLIILVESPNTRFLLGPLDNPASNHKSRLRFGWIKGSSLYLSFKQLLYVSWKEKINSSNYRKI